jgi:hypothetical protein
LSTVFWLLVVHRLQIVESRTRDSRAFSSTEK